MSSLFTVSIMKKVLTGIATLGFGGYLVLWSILASFQWNSSFWQQRHAASIYTVPVHAKGVVVYLSAPQAFWYNLADAWIIWVFFIGILAGALYRVLERREATRRARI